MILACPLRDHLDEIRKMRRARRTWREITEHLRARHGLQITRTGVCHFFRRASSRPLPMGMEDPPPNTASAPPRFAPEQKKEFNRNTINKTAEPGWSGYNPEEGLNYVPKD